MSNYTDYLYMPTGGNYYAKAEPLNTGTWSTGVVAYTENGTTGSYAATLDSATAYAVFQRAGADPASSDTLVAFVPINYLYDFSQSTILPIYGTVTAAASASYIAIKTSEAITVTVALTDADGDAVSTVGMSLELVFESGSTEVVISNSDITKSSTGFSFVVPSTLNSSERLWSYTCRKTTDEAVLCSGKLEVIYAPNN